jgi:hypothetical protein
MIKHELLQAENAISENLLFQQWSWKSSWQFKVDWVNYGLEVKKRDSSWMANTYLMITSAARAAPTRSNITVLSCLLGLMWAIHSGYSQQG